MSKGGKKIIGVNIKRGIRKPCDHKLKYKIMFGGYYCPTCNKNIND